jgi:uncharacterized Tic20 family protein
MCCSSRLSAPVVLDDDAPHEVRAAAALVHAAALAALLFPVFGFAFGPFLAWATRRDLDPFVEQQGRAAVAFGATAALATGFAWLCGFQTAFFAIYGVATVLALVAAYGAYRGRAMRYPFTFGPFERWARGA